MAKKISQLPELTSLPDDAIHVVVVNGANYKIKNTKFKSSITKADIGLGNVDNTSDLDKPVSIDTQSALNQKANLLDLQSGLASKSDQGHTHTVDEIADLADQLADVNHTHTLDSLPEVQNALASKSDQGHGHAIDQVVGLDSRLTDLEDGLSTKANSTEVNAAIASKADAVLTANALATKATHDELNNALLTKAEASDVIAALANKVDLDVFNTAIANISTEDHRHSVSDIDGLQDLISQTVELEQDVIVAKTEW